MQIHEAFAKFETIHGPKRTPGPENPIPQPEAIKIHARRRNDGRPREPIGIEGIVYGVALSAALYVAVVLAMIAWSMP